MRANSLRRLSFNKNCLREGGGVDEKAMIEWARTAQKLARGWHGSMLSKSYVKIEEYDIYDFLIDIWIKKGGQGPEFEEAGYKRLYSYALAWLSRSRDTLRHSINLSQYSSSGDGGFDEDRLGCFSSTDDEDGDEEMEDPGFVGTDRVDQFEELNEDQIGVLSLLDDEDGDEEFMDPESRLCLNEELGERLEELAAIRDTGLARALSDVFGITDRRCRSFGSEIRKEKTLALIAEAAKKRGMKPAEVKKLAAEIAAERRKTIARINEAGGNLNYSEIESFEEMMGLVKPTTPAPTAKTVKNCLLEAKRQRKSAPAMPKVQQQSMPMQLELV